MMNKFILYLDESETFNSTGRFFSVGGVIIPDSQTAKVSSDLNLLKASLWNGNSIDKSNQNSVELLYHGKTVAWRESRNTYFNPARFQKRLCEDFCINGFQFLYDIVNSAQPDFNLYSRAPEILQDLDYLLNAGLVNNFRSISHTFVALCRIPIDRVFFERNAGEKSFEERYIYSALWYIWEYCYSKAQQGHNYMLYCPDDYTVRVEKWIPEEKIKQQPQPY